MKKLLFFSFMVFMIGCMSGCSSSRNKHTTSYVPCSEYKNSKGVFRVWTMGRGISKADAQLRAWNSAAVEMSAMLDKCVAITSTNYCALLGNTIEANSSKGYLREKFINISNKSQEGAGIICNESVVQPDKSVCCYLVLEYDGRDFLNNYKNVLSDKSRVEIDVELFQRLFLKNVDSIEP